MIECNWMRFFSQLSGLKNGDSTTMRWVKSYIVSKFLEAYSNLTYVDKIGYDYVMDDGTKIELKTQKSIFPKTKNKTSPVKLKNGMGNGKINKTFDFLLLIQTGEPRVAYISWEDAEPFITQKGHDFYIKGIDFNKLHFIETNFYAWELETDILDIESAIDKIVEARL